VDPYITWKYDRWTHLFPIPELKKPLNIKEKREVLG
jgi:hypothetical protein